MQSKLGFVNTHNFVDLYPGSPQLIVVSVKVEISAHITHTRPRDLHPEIDTDFALRPVTKFL